MTRPVSTHTNLTGEHAASNYAQRPVELWALTVILVAVACIVLVLDAATTPELRIALSAQSGIFP